MKKLSFAAFLLTLFLILTTGCGGQKSETAASPAPADSGSNPSNSQSSPDVSASDAKPADTKAQETNGKPADSTAAQETNGKAGDLMVVANPDSIAVLVNKQYALPENYEPNDLVYPDVPFIFKEKIEKRMLRKEAADALKQMFDAAKQDGISLAGVSGYRSYERQKALFESYVRKDGEEKAKTYSAVPGSSEHETGLAIDVSGSDGACAASECFAGTPEAEWIAGHAADYGFIVRYPQGKEAITGYTYEPWHIRYVGPAIAKEIADKNETLEEYYNAIPVSGKS